MKNQIIIGIATALLLFTFQFSYSQDVLQNKDIVSLQDSKMSQDIIQTKIAASKCQFNLTADGLAELKAGRVSDRIVKAMLAASPSTEIITNEDVIKMSTSAISRDIMKEKIKLTAHKFDTSSEGLIKLKTAKVPDPIIKEMLTNPSQTGFVPAKPELPSPQKATSTNSHEDAVTAKKAEKSVSPETSQNIIITTAFEEVKNLQRLGEVSASAKRPFAGQTVLRADAIEKIKKQAIAKGATHVLIQSDNFAMTPINNVTIVGVAYKK